MKVHSDQVTAITHRSGPSSKSDRTLEVAGSQSKSTAAAAKRPDAVPPGFVSRAVYLSYAVMGLVFALYNTNLVVHQMAAPREDPGFSAAALFFCMGMIPTVVALYLTAGIKAALIKKLGIKTIFIMGGMLVLFSLLVWSVLIVSQADMRATLIGFFLPMVVRVTFQDPGETIKEANQRILVYFSGMLFGLGLVWALDKYTTYDVRTHSDTFLAFSSVVLVSQLLQVWHASVQTIAIFRWARQVQPTPVLS